MAPQNTDIWEQHFQNKQEMWWLEPAKSALMTRDFFHEKWLQNILIPGIGYGRNAQIFRESSMSVAGIEISETAIEIGKKHYGESITFYNGSVTDMPFDDVVYDGIFCYWLIYLLGEDARRKLIRDCFAELETGGYMVFTVISKMANTYGTGRFLSTDRYEIHPGIEIFFYDRDSIRDEFGEYGLIDLIEVDEKFPFFMITCRK